MDVKVEVIRVEMKVARWQDAEDIVRGGQRRMVYV